MMIQTVNGVQLYLSHYGLVNQPDGTIPPATWVDSSGNPGSPFAAPGPLALQRWQRSGGGPNKLSAADGGQWSGVPHRLAPAALQPQIPQDLLLQLTTVLNNNLQLDISWADVKASLETVLVAAAQPRPVDPTTTSARIRGPHLDLTRDAWFDLTFQTGWLYPPGATGIFGATLTNGDVATALGAMITVDPAAPFTISFGGTLALSTENSYTRSVASQPAPTSVPFPPGATSISFVGTKMDSAGNYGIVASLGTGVLAAPTATLGDAIPALFGTADLSAIELAYAETGTLVDA
jgi:hypothetical protein